MKIFIKSLIYYFISAFGISLTVISGIGVSSYSSMSLSISSILNIKFGTIMTIQNLSFLLFYFIILKNKDFKKILIMLISLISFGYVTNFYLYYILKDINFNNYFANIILFIIGTIIAGFGSGKVLKLDTLKFPLEAFCKELEKYTNFNFSFYRYSLDFLFGVISLLLSYFFNVPYFIREGTIISLFLLPGVISFFSKDFSFYRYKKSRD